MISLSEEEHKYYEEPDVCHICKFYLDENDENKNDESENDESKNDENDNDKNEKYQKFKGHSHYTRKLRGAAYSYCNLRYKVLNNILIVTHNAG